MKILTFQAIAEHAGFLPGVDGKLNLPAEQATADALAAAAVTLLGDWSPGQLAEEVTLTGPGPVWGYLTIAHALHGRVPRLLYAAPNAPELVIFSHGV